MQDLCHTKSVNFSLRMMSGSAKAIEFYSVSKGYNNANLFRICALDQVI